MTTLGFLHTADVHVTRFDALVGAAGDGALAGTRHLVRPDLLERARRGGSDRTLAVDVAAALADLAAQDVDVVVCTCSTLGALAEAVDLPVAVVRVDRPMAAAAVVVGPRVGVVAALASTLGPTRRLLEEEAARAGVAVRVVERCASDAWEAFERGEVDAYLDRVVAAARSLAGEVDVVVLAQASMAGAEQRLADLDAPVLSSPALAVEAALALGR